MKPRIYIETSIISYLAARPSRDLITAAHQQVTHEWWDTRRSGFEVVVSQLVLDEAEAGDSDVAQRRVRLLADVPILEIDTQVEGLAAALVKGLALPRRAEADAVHIAVATRHDLSFLLTWNCTHIANAQLRARIERICGEHGYRAPVLCTPEELMGAVEDEEDA